MGGVESLEILGCDSIFEFDGQAFGKPSDKSEAFQRWIKMSANNGLLHTGHTLLCCEFDCGKGGYEIRNQFTEVVSSKIFFSHMKVEEVHKYVESEEPLYCAGGFALEGLGGKYIDRIEGCFSNVMGLSLPWLRKELLKNGIMV